jgi:hypothetical protein
MNLALRLSISGQSLGGPASPSISLSANSIPENTAQGTTIGVATPRNASNPGAVSVISQTLANAIAMTGDGVSFAVGSAGGATGTLNYEAVTSFSVTFGYTDDSGAHQFTRGFTITDVDDGPTTAGAATDLQTMLGAPQVGEVTSGDLRDLFVSPTSQTLSFTVSHGSIDVDGYSWTWTPATEQTETVDVTATDEDGQELTVSFDVDVLAAAVANSAPVAADVTLDYVVPPPAAAGVPDQFGTGDWSIADDGTSGDVTITITTLPADNGDALTDLEYRIGAGSWVSMGAATTGDYAVSGLTDGTSYNFSVRAVNSTGSGTASATKSVTPTGIPAQFGTGDWAVADAGTNGDVTVSIITLPSAAGSSITDIEYQIDAGSWVSLGGATTGDYNVAGLTDTTSYSFAVRAVNANGNGTASATKSATPTGVPSAFTAGQWSIADDTTGGDATITITAIPAANGSTITDLERKIGAGAWTSLAGTSTGTYALANLFTDGVSTNVLIRAVNGNGTGPDSDTKSVTTTTAGAASITRVGTAGDSAPSGANIVIDLTAIAGIADGDLVVAFAGASSGVDTAITMVSSGWTPLTASLFADDSFKSNVRVWTKVMGSTPDTGVTMTGANNSAGGGGGWAIALRDVDAAILDVTAVTQGGTNSALANAAAITPVTAGAMIAVLGFASSDPTPVAFTGPANMTGFEQVSGAGSTRGGTAFIAFKDDWTSGAFDPDALTGGETSSSCSFMTVTLAFKPA